MPLVSVMKKDLDEKLGFMTQEEFEERCFQFGIELDEGEGLHAAAWRASLAADDDSASAPPDMLPPHRCRHFRRCYRHRAH
jgi:hypothetical protein